MSKDNPLPLRQLIHLLGLPAVPYVPKYSAVRKGKITGIEWQKLKRTKEIRIKERKEFLNQYKVGTYKEYEGDGYFVQPLYFYEGEYYG